MWLLYLRYSLCRKPFGVEPTIFYLNGKCKIIGFFGLFLIFYHEFLYFIDNTNRVNFEEATAKTKSQLHRNETSATEKSNPITPDSEKYIIAYACILVVGIIFYLVRSISFYQMCLRISINLHDMIFRGVTRAKMIFFNNNPSGRILNRFARDINNVDSMLPNALFDVIKVSGINFSFLIFHVHISSKRNHIFSFLVFLAIFSSYHFKCNHKSMDSGTSYNSNGFTLLSACSVYQYWTQFSSSWSNE